MLNKERAKEITEKAKTDRALFNWCEEYKDFISNGVACCVSQEWDYMLKKSYEDNESPISYEDLDLFDCDKAREALIYNLEENDKLKEMGGEEYINALNKEDLKQMCQEVEIDANDTDGEVYEWWILNDDLKFWLERQGEIFLNNAWGRCTTGQSISLDGCCINAFLDLLNERYLKY